MTSSARGFTLIELMIVVAIIALLAAIALPAYNAYRIKSAESACLMEMKNYANFALASYYTNASATIKPPPQSACSAGDTFVDMDTPIVGTPQIPGVKKTTCDMHSANCVLPP